VGRPHGLQHHHRQPPLRPTSHGHHGRESEGAKTAYQLVDDADRPELCFKSTASGVVGPGAAVRIRPDSTWDAPEPELALAVSAHGEVFGYRIGNDMSSRSIEGDNPLYPPQAKTCDRSTALGPCILVTNDEPGTDTTISMRVERADVEEFSGSTSVGQIKRSFAELVEYLHREQTFKAGCFQLTGAGIVPGSDFALTPGDRVSTDIDGIGTLTNHVERQPAR
jgi:2-dehydro-3-deoxy-D-arabinonate dehydratase